MKKESAKKVRIDALLVEQGFFSDVEEARRWVMAGKVLVDDRVIDKPGSMVRANKVPRLRGADRRFVSRGGFKLEAALDAFGIDAHGAVALDLGASTGGFTDCLLQRGAQKVFAVDVGTNQLDYRLRSDERVISLEQTHAKDLNSELVPDRLSLVVTDVSFTSLAYVLPPTLALAEKGCDWVCLFKPQFEVPREAVGAGGIVRDEAAVAAASERVTAALAEAGLTKKKCLPCPLKGREGNQEYLWWLTEGR